MPQRASFDYANPASVVFLPSDQDSTINVSTATANLHYRTGGGWTGPRTITVEGTPADGLTVVVSNNSGQSVGLINGTGSPLDVGTLPLVVRDGEWVGLVTNASTSKLIDATGAVGLDARGDLASQNTITVSQISDPGNLNAAQLGSASATDGYVLKADGSGGTAWEAESGGGVDTTESTVTPETLTYLAWDGAIFAPTAAPASEPTELSRDPTAYSSAQANTTLTTGQAVLNVPAVTFAWGPNSFSTMEMATIPAGSSPGTYYFALVVDTSTLAGGDLLRLELEDSTDVNADDWVDVNHNDPTGWIEAGNATVNGCRLLGTAENSDSRTIQRGTDLHEVIVVVDVSVAPTNDVWIGINAQVNSKSLTAGMLTLRDADYDPDAGGDAAKVQPTGFTGGGTLVLTTDANQAATVTGDTQLALPSPPGSGVRDLVARVTVSSGSLTLPSSGVAIFGEAGPFSSDVRLAIRQYGDGSNADIYAVTEV